MMDFKAFLPRKVFCVLCCLALLFQIIGLSTTGWFVIETVRVSGSDGIADALKGDLDTSTNVPTGFPMENTSKPMRPGKPMKPGKPGLTGTVNKDKKAEATENDLTKNTGMERKKRDAKRTTTRPSKRPGGRPRPSKPKQKTTTQSTIQNNSEDVAPSTEIPIANNGSSRSTPKYKTKKPHKPGTKPRRTKPPRTTKPPTDDEPKIGPHLLTEGPKVGPPLLEGPTTTPPLLAEGPKTAPPLRTNKPKTAPPLITERPKPKSAPPLTVKPRTLRPGRTAKPKRTVLPGKPKTKSPFKLGRKTKKPLRGDTTSVRPRFFTNPANTFQLQAAFVQEPATIRVGLWVTEACFPTDGCSSLDSLSSGMSPKSSNLQAHVTVILNDLRIETVCGLLACVIGTAGCILYLKPVVFKDRPLVALLVGCIGMLLSGIVLFISVARAVPFNVTLSKMLTTGKVTATAHTPWSVVMSSLGASMAILTTVALAMAFYTDRKPKFESFKSDVQFTMEATETAENAYDNPSSDK